MSVVFPKDDGERQRLLAVIAEQTSRGVVLAGAPPPDDVIKLPRPEYASARIAPPALTVSSVSSVAAHPSQAGGVDYKSLREIFRVNDFGSMLAFNEYLEKYTAANVVPIDMGIKTALAQEIADKKTQIAFYKMASTVLNNFYEATKAWIEIGEVEANINYLSSRIAKVERALSTVALRQSVGMATGLSVLSQGMNVQAERARLELLHGQRQSLLSKLQIHLGQRVNEVNVPFDGAYNPIEEAQAQQMLAHLIGPNSPNFLLRMAQDIEDNGGLLLNINTSADEIMLRARQAKRQVEVDFRNAIESMRTNAGLIKMTQVALETAQAQLNYIERNPNTYSAERQAGPQSNITDLVLKLNHYKAGYLKAAAALKRLGVWSMDGQFQSGSAVHAPSQPILRMPMGSITVQVPKPIQYVSENIFDRFSARRTAPDILFPGRIEYSDDLHLMFLSMTDISEIAIGDPNIIQRAKAVKLLLNDYQDGEGFLGLLENTVLKTSHVDVREQIFKFMVERADNNMDFFVRIAAGAIKAKQETLARESLRALGNILIANPQVLHTYREGGLSAVFGDVRTVLLNFLIWPDASETVKKRILGDFWDLDELARIHHALSALPVTDMSRQLSARVYDEILRRFASANAQEYFRYSSPAYMAWPLDIANAFLEPWTKDQILQFLSEAPTAKAMEVFLSEKLFKMTREGADQLLDRNKIKDQANLELINLGGSGQGMIDYFDQLSPAQQDKYIATASLGYLKDILKSSTSSLLSSALDRMIKTPEGRAQVMDVYLRTQEERRLQLIQERAWEKILKEDLQDASGVHVHYDILRQGLLEMSKHASGGRKDLLLNLRLQFVPVPLLHKADDPRGKGFVEAEIRRRSIGVALGVLLEKDKYKMVLYNGDALYSPESRGILKTVAKKLDVNDPREVGEYLDSKSSNSTVRDILNESESISKRIRANDQSFPLFSIAGFSLLLSLGVLTSLVGGRFVYSNYISVNGSKDVKGLMTELQIESDIQPKRRGAFKLETFDIDIPGTIIDKFRKPLSQWRQEMQQLSRGNSSPDELIGGLNNILNQVFLVLGQTRYQPALMFNKNNDPAVNNDGYQKGFNHFNLLAVETLYFITDYLEAHKKRLSDGQRQDFQQIIDVLVKANKYGVHYVRALEYRHNIDRVLSNKFESGHNIESFGGYVFLRPILGYRSSLVQSQRALRSNISSLLDLGNELMEDTKAQMGLYPSKMQIMNESEALLKEAIDGAKPLVSSGASRSQQRGAKIRRYIGRSLLVGAPLLLFSAAFLGPLCGVFVGGGVSTAGAVALLLGLSNFWWENINALQMRKLKINDRVLNLLKEKSTILLDSLKGYVDRGAEQILHEELGSSRASALDMIVIVPENQDEIPAVEQLVSSRLGILFRRDGSVKVMPKAKNGSGNIYLEANAFAQLEISKRGLSWDKARVLFIFHGQGQSISAIEPAVINGYRSARANNTSKQHIVIYTRDHYSSSITRPLAEADIYFMGAWVGKDESKRQRLLNLRSNGSGKEDVGEILELFDVDALRPGRLMSELSDRYDLNSPALMLPAFLGTMVFGARTIRILENLNQRLNNDPIFRGKLKYIHFTRDIMNVLLKENINDVEEYLVKRLRWDDINDHYGDKNDGEIFSLLKRFYLLLLELRGQVPLKVDVFIPSPWNKDMQYQPSASFSPAMAGDVLKTVFPPGGLDLSTTRDNMEFNSKIDDKPNRPPVPSPLPVPSLNAFQGFEFNIIVEEQPLQLHGSQLTYQ